jgi:hypothetical protein
MRYRLAALLLLLAPVSLAAQERGMPSLPDDLEDRIHEMQTDPDALRLTGPASIPADSVIQGGTLDGQKVEGKPTWPD